MRPHTVPPPGADWRSGPERAWIVTTSKCNLNCVHCARSIPEFRAEAESTPDMEEEIFARFEEQVAPTLRTVQFGGSNLGEPMVSSKLEAYVERLKRLASVREIKIQTNGTFLWNRDRVQALVRAGVRLMVSLEGVREESYRSVRGLAFRHLMRGLREVKGMRAAHPGSGSELKLAFTVSYDTLGELIPLVEMAAEVGASQVTVGHLIPTRESQRSQSLCYHRGEANAAIAAAGKRAAELGIRFVAPRPFLIRSLEDDSARVERAPEPPCFHPWRSVSINERGDVMPCCATNAVMGNLRKDAFRTIWQGRRYRKLRERVNSDRPPWFCRGCVLRGVDLDSPSAEFHTEESYLLGAIGVTQELEPGEILDRARKALVRKARAQVLSNALARRFVLWLRGIYWRYCA